MIVITICDKCGFEFVTELRSYNDLRTTKVICSECAHHSSVIDDEEDVFIDTRPMAEALRDLKNDIGE